jgi:hypothetical protein
MAYLYAWAMMAQRMPSVSNTAMSVNPAPMACERPRPHGNERDRAERLAVRPRRVPDVECASVVERTDRGCPRMPAQRSGCPAASQSDVVAHEAQRQSRGQP